MNEFESTGGIDPAAFGESLFSSSDKEPPVETPSLPSVSLTNEGTSTEGSPTPAPTAAAEGAAEAAGVTQAEWDALPKAWRKEMEAEWKTAPENIRKYVHEREKQVTQGITQYRQGSDNWAKVMAPFESIMREYPDANPSEILATLAQNHIQMVRSTPDERRTHALALARGYGVDFATATAIVDAQNTPPTQSAEGFSPSQIAELNRVLGPVMQSQRQSTEFVNKQLTDAATAEVDKFFSDSKNEFVNEVADDILSLMKQGQVTNLPDAYELAVLRNPAVKAKYLASLAAKSAAPPSTASKLPNVKSSATPSVRGKPQTIDDTFAEVMKKYYP